MKLRAGEAIALDWVDVDLRHRTILVHQAIDQTKNRNETKATKTNRARRARIWRTLMPLLVALQNEASTGRVFSLKDLSTRSGNSGYAEVLREDLKRAGCDSIDPSRLHERGKQ